MSIEGVFNFQERYPGPHMIRVRLRKYKAWDMLRQLSHELEGDREHVEFAWFGDLFRDSEEDKGNPILVEFDPPNSIIRR